MMKRTQFDDYMNAVRKGSREAAMEHASGWKAVNRPHTNSKKYDRKKVKDSLLERCELCR
jgi:hypothetical protein